MTKKEIRNRLIRFFENELNRLKERQKVHLAGTVDWQNIKGGIDYCEYLLNAFINHKLDHIIKS
jgi:hypothetical protein